MAIMTVSALIRALKKMPPTAQLAVRDHDQSLGEMNGWLTGVDEAEAELYEARRAAGDHLNPSRKIVVLSV